MLFAFVLRRRRGGRCIERVGGWPEFDVEEMYGAAGEGFTHVTLLDTPHRHHVTTDSFRLFSGGSGGSGGSGVSVGKWG